MHTIQAQAHRQAKYQPPYGYPFNRIVDNSN
jgi:hypothetical protein